MATCSSILSWKISWTEEPGRLQSMWLQRVGHDWSDLAHKQTTVKNLLFVLCFLGGGGGSGGWQRRKNNIYSRYSLFFLVLEVRKRLSSLIYLFKNLLYSVLGVHWKDWCWSWNSSTLAIWCKELTHLKRPWCRERLRAGGEGNDRGWDGWMVSPTQWTWVWVNSGSWWWTAGLVCCDSWGCKELNTTEQLNWTESLR